MTTSSDFLVVYTLSLHLERSDYSLERSDSLVERSDQRMERSGRNSFNHQSVQKSVIVEQLDCRGQTVNVFQEQQWA